MAVESGPVGPILARPGFSSSAQRGFTLVGGHMMGGRDMHVRIQTFYLSCSATATELYPSCVATPRDIPEKPHQLRDFNCSQAFFWAKQSSYAFFPANLVQPVAIHALL